MKPLSATYRLQLRQGVDFDRAAELLAHIDTLGASHLYLSPIFTAPEDSTHGYDVADPSQIDPILGGRAGFERLAHAAQARGIGIVLDLVPNHTVLSVENPWLLDALKHGAASAYADFFDVDWDEGLILPVLPEPFDDMAAAGAFEINAAEERIEWQGGWLPLAPGTAGLALPEMMRAQHWRLRFWERERRRLTHRRFFNVTTLIGMRIEEQKGVRCDDGAAGGAGARRAGAGGCASIMSTGWRGPANTFPGCARRWGQRCLSGSKRS